MCGIRNFDKKTRRIYAAANVCMLLGVMPTVLEVGLHGHHPFYTAARFVLLSAAIVLYLWVVRQKNRPAPPANGHA